MPEEKVISSWDEIEDEATPVTSWDETTQSLKKKDGTQLSTNGSVNSAASQSSSKSNLISQSVKTPDFSTIDITGGIGNTINVVDKNVLGKGSTVTENKNSTTVANPYDVSGATKQTPDNTDSGLPNPAKTIETQRKAQELQQIKADRDAANPNSFQNIGASYKTKASKLAGNNDVEKMLNYGDINGNSKFVIDLLDEDDKDLYTTKVGIEDIAKTNAMYDKQLKSGAISQDQYDAIKKNNDKLLIDLNIDYTQKLKKRNGNIDEQISEAQSKLANGVYIPEIGNYQQLDAKELQAEKDKIKYLTGIKNDVLIDINNPVKSLQKHEGFQQAEKEGLIPSNATNTQKIKIYSNILVDKVKKLAGELGYDASDAQSLLGNNFMDANGRKMMFESLKSLVVGTNDKEKDFIHTMAELQAIAPIAALNKNNLTLNEGYTSNIVSSFRKSVAPMFTKNQIATDQDRNALTSEAFNEAGINNVNPSYSSKQQATEKESQTLGKTVARTAGDVLGIGVKIGIINPILELPGAAIEMATGVPIFKGINKALSTSKEAQAVEGAALSGASAAAKTVGEVKQIADAQKVLDIAKVVSDKIPNNFLTRTIYNATKAGTVHEIQGNLNKDLEGFANFGVGAVNSLIGMPINALGNVAIKMFGKDAPAFVARTIDALKSGTSMTATMAGMTGVNAAREAESLDAFKETLDEHFGTNDKRVRFVAENFLLGLALHAGNVGNLSNLFKSNYEKQYNELSDPEKEKLNEFTEDVNNEVNIFETATKEAVEVVQDENHVPLTTEKEAKDQVEEFLKPIENEQQATTNVEQEQVNNDSSRLSETSADNKTDGTVSKAELSNESEVPKVEEKAIEDAEYNDFIDKGKVSEERLNDIAKKIKNQENLSIREQEIFTDKTAEINKILKNQSKVETQNVNSNLSNNTELKTNSYDSKESEANALKRLADGISELPADQQATEIERRAKEHADSYKEYLKENPVNDETVALPRVAEFETQTADALKKYVNDAESWKGREENKFENGGRIDENGKMLSEQTYIDLKEHIVKLRQDGDIETIDIINKEPAKYYEENKAEFTPEDQGGGAQPPVIDTETETVTSDGKVRKKALLNRAYNGEDREEIKTEIEKIGLEYSVENQIATTKATNDLIEKFGIDNVLDSVRRSEIKGGSAAVVYDAKIRSIEEKMFTANDAELADLIKEQADLYSELDEMARKGGQFNSMLNHIYKTSDLAYSYQRQKEIFKKINDGKFPADIKIKFEELSKKIKESQQKINELEKTNQEIEEKYKESVSKEEADKAVADAYEKGKQEGTIGKETKKYTKKAKQVADKFRELKKKPFEFEDGNGNKIILTENSIISFNEIIEAGAKIIEISGKIADGVSHVINEVKETDWYKNMSPNKKSEFENKIEEQFGENKTEADEKRFSIGNARVKEIVERRRSENEDTTIEDVVEELNREFPDKTPREVRDAITDYGVTKEASTEPDDVTVRKIKRMGRYISALEDIENGERPSRSGQQRDKPDPEERKLLKDIREGLKKLPLSDADLSKKLKSAQDIIETRLNNRIEDLDRQIATGEKSTRINKVESNPEIDRLREEVEKRKQQLADIESQSKHSDTLQELQDIADKTGQKVITKKEVDNGLISDLLQAHIERGTPMKDVQKQMFDELKSIFPNITQRQVLDAITKKAEFTPEPKDKTELQKQLSELKKQYNLQTKIEDTEKGIVDVSKLKGADSQEVKDLRKELSDAKSEAKNKYPSVSAKELKKEIERVKKRTAEIDRKRNAGEFVKKEVVKKRFTNDSEWVANNKILQAEKIKKLKAQFEFDLEQEKNRMANRSDGEKRKDIFLDAIGMSKALVATFDLSAPLRQGIGLGLSNPKEYAKSFVEMHRFLKKANFDDYMEKLQASDEFQVMNESGLAITNPNGKASAREDVFMNNLAKKIPVYKIFYNASERAYSGFLNKLRADVFRKGVRLLEEQGIKFEEEPEKYKALAKAINNATGRGSLGSQEKNAKELGAIFFSPRMITSRVGMVQDIIRKDSSPVVRKMAAKNLAGTFSYIAIMHSLFAYLQSGDEKEGDDFLDNLNLNPVGTDFLKNKQGTTRYDHSAGFVPLIRTIARIGSGNKFNADGEYTNLDFKGYNTPSRLSEIGQFGKNKLSPFAKVIYSWVANEDVENFKKPFSYKNAGISLVAPLNVRDYFKGNIKMDGWIPKLDKKGDLYSNTDKYIEDRLLSLYGDGLQNYGEEEVETKEDKAKKAKLKNENKARIKDKEANFQRYKK